MYMKAWLMSYKQIFITNLNIHVSFFLAFPNNVIINPISTWTEAMADDHKESTIEQRKRDVIEAGAFE